MDSLITKQEIEKFRIPTDFIKWFEAYLEKTRLDKTFRRQILLRKGIAKEIYEEIFPLYRFLQFFGIHWSTTAFMNRLGSQNYDVEVHPKEFAPFEYIEITVADASHEEFLRNTVLVDKGHVSAIGKVSHSGTKQTGKSIHVCNDFRSHAELNNEKKIAIKSAIHRKLQNTYPPQTALLIYFTDYVAFADEDDQLDMKLFITELGTTWESTFCALYIIGASGRRGWMKIKGA